MPYIWQVLPSHNIFFAAECVFADFAIAVIFYPVIKNILCILFGCCYTQISNLRGRKINFANMLKIKGLTQFSDNFSHFFKIDFFLSKLISGGDNIQIIFTHIFIKFVLQHEKLLSLQNQHKTSCSKKNVVAGKNLPYAL